MMFGQAHLHSHKSIVHKNFFRQKVRTDSSLVASAELLIDLGGTFSLVQASDSRGPIYELIHKAGLPDTAVSKYDDLLSRISTEARPAVCLLVVPPRPTFKRTFLREAMLTRRLALTNGLLVPSCF